MKHDSNLDFNGMKGDGVNNAKSKFNGNQHAGTSDGSKSIMKGRGPTVGNKSATVPKKGK